jgi:hypothetical protein
MVPEGGKMSELSDRERFENRGKEQRAERAAQRAEEAKKTKAADDQFRADAAGTSELFSHCKEQFTNVALSANSRFSIERAKTVPRLGITKFDGIDYVIFVAKGLHVCAIRQRGGKFELIDKNGKHERFADRRTLMEYFIEHFSGL